MVSSSVDISTVLVIIGFGLVLIYFICKVGSELDYHEELLKDHIEAINNHAEYLEAAKDAIDNHAKHIDNINSFLKDLGDCLDEEEDIEGGDNQNG